MWFSDLEGLDKPLSLVYAPKELLEESAKRIGVYISELPTPQSLPSPKKVEKWDKVFKKD